MDITHILQKPHLSASSVNSYIDCGLAYKFAKIDRIKPEFIPDTMAFGTVIHHTLENYYMEKKAGILLSLKEVHACFEALWEMEASRNEEIHYSKGKTYQSYIIEGKDLLSAWYDKLPKNGFKVIGTEVGFAFTIAGMDIPIVGFMDLIEEDESRTVIVTDFKTSAKAYSTDEIDNNMQMLVYHLSMKQNGYADREILLKLDCLIKTKTPKFESYYTTRTEDDEKRLIRKIKSVWDGISKGVFLPNDTGWKCKGCLYKNACNNWFLKGE
jgi:putative RecB family exonuclease